MTKKMQKNKEEKGMKNYYFMACLVSAKNKKIK